MITTFFPSTVKVGFPHLRSSLIAKPASTRRIAAISASHRSRYAISIPAPLPGSLLGFIHRCRESRWGHGPDRPEHCSSWPVTVVLGLPWVRVIRQDGVRCTRLGGANASTGAVCRERGRRQSCVCEARLVGPVSGALHAHGRGGRASRDHRRRGGAARRL